MAIERILSDINGIAITARIGQYLGPRIAGGELEIAFAFSCVKLHAVVVGVGIGEPIEDLSKSFERTQRISVYVWTTIRGQIRRQGFEWNLIEIRLSNQVSTQVANVARLDKETTRQLSLDTKTKVHRISDVEVGIDG